MTGGRVAWTVPGASRLRALIVFGAAPDARSALLVVLFQLRKLTRHVVRAHCEFRVFLVLSLGHDEDVVAAIRAVRVPSAHRRPDVVHRAEASLEIEETTGAPIDLILLVAHDPLALSPALLGELRARLFFGQLELDDLAFQPLSPEDAERLSGTVGVPLETAVNLLQDSEGRIKLKLPVSGPVNQPEVDVSSAVNKAIRYCFRKYC